VERRRADGLNPGVPLPDAAIAVVRRADGSGTSFIFTNYLSKVNAEWKAKVGEGTAVNWPVGAGGKGNEGVAAFVQRLPNSIGYVEYAYVKQNKMTFTLMKNKDGNFVTPTTRPSRPRPPVPTGTRASTRSPPSSPARTPGR
jgi:phosphate transport system substrate-binding protein